MTSVNAELFHREQDIAERAHCDDCGMHLSPDGSCAGCDGERDPTPWCDGCGATSKDNCNCGPLADND